MDRRLSKVETEIATFGETLDVIHTQLSSIRKTLERIENNFVHLNYITGAGSNANRNQSS